MSLLGLPAELLDDIIALTLPESLENFALSCKTVYQVGKDYIERHNEYKRKWRHFRYDEGTVNNNGIKIPLEIVAAIIKDPLIAEYIEVAHLWPTQDIKFEEENERIAVVFRDMDRKAVIHTLIRRWEDVSKDAVLPSSDLEILENCLRDGSGYKAQPNWGFCNAVMLLMLLPNLRELGLPFYWEEWWSSSEPDEIAILETVVRRANDPAARGASLSKLERIIPHAPIEYSDRNALAELGPFMALQSLKELYACNCVGVEDGYTGIPFDWPYPDMNSGLRRIELEGCCIGTDGITELVKHTPHLTVLKYSHDTKWHGCLYEWDAGGFVDAVGSALVNTLEELAITVSGLMGGVERGVTSLHQFKCLERLEFDVHMFNAPPYGSEDEEEEDTEGPPPKPWTTADVPSLAAILPPSIRSVHLFQAGEGVGHGLAVDVLYQLLRDFPPKDESPFTDLTELDFRAIRGTVHWADFSQLPHEVTAWREAIVAECGEIAAIGNPHRQSLWEEEFDRRFWSARR